MSDAVDPRVDAYINALPDWQQAICREVRELVHAADPEVAETIKFTNRPYFVLHGTICALLGPKTTSTCFSMTVPSSPTRRGSSPAATTTQPQGRWRSAEGETINAAALRAMFEQIIADNRSGGWRKLKREGRHER